MKSEAWDSDRLDGLDEKVSDSVDREEGNMTVQVTKPF